MYKQKDTEIPYALVYSKCSHHQCWASPKLGAVKSTWVSMRAVGNQLEPAMICCILISMKLEWKQNQDLAQAIEDRFVS